MSCLAWAWQNGYKPIQWLPLLQATVAGVRMEKESEAAISLQLLTIAVETGREFVASYVPAIAAVVQVVTCKNLPSNSEPWPQVSKELFAVSLWK